MGKTVCRARGTKHPGNRDTILNRVFTWKMAFKQTLEGTEVFNHECV